MRKSGQQEKNVQNVREQLTSIRQVSTRKLLKELQKINDIIEYVAVESITELN